MASCRASTRPPSRCGCAAGGRSLALTDRHPELDVSRQSALNARRARARRRRRRATVREHVFNLLALALDREPVRIAALAFETDDPYLRGTALEYLETVLPSASSRARTALLATHAAARRGAARRRGAAEARAELLHAGVTLKVSLDEVRRQLAASEGDREVSTPHRNAMHNQPSPAAADDTNRILLVDDDATNLDVLRTTLEGHGYRLFFARSGEDALKVARRARPGLILLDVVMPGIDGYETCRLLKDDPETRDAAVIFLSALDDAKDKVRGFEAGAVDFVTKPFQGDEVVARVHTHLSIQRLLRRQREAEPPSRQSGGRPHTHRARRPDRIPWRRPAVGQRLDWSAHVDRRGRAGRPVFRPGDVVAYRFRIVRYLAKGGMGELYEAEDLELHERVALKTILSSIANDERSILLFKREVHLARQVTHANVCRIYDVFRHRPAGDSGSRRRGGVPGDGTAAWRNARRSARARWTIVDRGRAAARAADGGGPWRPRIASGVVHRDFKSQNVMLVEPAPPDREAAGGDHGFRAGAAQRARRPHQRGVADRRARDFWHPGLHGAGAGGGWPGDAGHGHLRARGRAVRDGHRRLAVHGRDSASHGRQTPAGAASEPTDPRARSGSASGSRRFCVVWPVAPADRFATIGDVVVGARRRAARGTHRRAGRARRWPSCRIVGTCPAALRPCWPAPISVYARVRYRPRASGRITSLAVLPFANTSRDPEQEYLSDGISESLINRLSQLPGLKVVANSSLRDTRARTPTRRRWRARLVWHGILAGRVLQRDDRSRSASS